MNETLSWHRRSGNTGEDNSDDEVVYQDKFSTNHASQPNNGNGFSQKKSNQKRVSYNFEENSGRNWRAQAIKPTRRPKASLCIDLKKYTQDDKKGWFDMAFLQAEEQGYKIEEDSTAMPSQKHGEKQIDKEKKEPLPKKEEKEDYDDNFDSLRPLDQESLLDLRGTEEQSPPMEEVNANQEDTWLSQLPERAETHSSENEQTPPQQKHSQPQRLVARRKRGWPEVGRNAQATISERGRGPRTGYRAARRPPSKLNIEATGSGLGRPAHWGRQQVRRPSTGRRKFKRHSMGEVPSTPGIKEANLQSRSTGRLRCLGLRPMNKGNLINTGGSGPAWLSNLQPVNRLSLRWVEDVPEDITSDREEDTPMKINIEEDEAVEDANGGDGNLKNGSAFKTPKITRSKRSRRKSWMPEFEAPLTSESPQTPFSSGSKPSRHGNQRRTGRLGQALMKVKQRAEGIERRLLSGEFPFRNTRITDHNDPRCACNSFVDVTILREIGPSKVEDFYNALCYVHQICFEYNNSQTREGSSDNIQQCNEMFVILFKTETVRAIGIKPLSRLRVYDPWISQNTGFRGLEEIVCKLNNPKDPIVSRGTPFILCSQICENFPESLDSLSPVDPSILEQMLEDF